MTNSRKTCGLIAIAALACAVATQPTAWAQEQDQGVEVLGDDDRPWAEGVSLDSQDRAREIFREANDLLREQLFKPAVDKYREALDLWDHPAIHYNISLALLSLDQPLELYHHLGKSLEHGVSPLISEANRERAENYFNIVSKQIAIIELSTTQEGVRVTLDSELKFIGPGRWKGPVLAGEHTLVATKRGYLTETKSLVLKAEKQTSVNLRLFTEDELITEERPLATWLPWTIAGTGTMVAGLGAVLHTRARNNYASFDTEFGELCQSPGDTCADEDFPELTSKLNTAKWQQRFGIGMYIAGGAALATGLTLVILNQPTITRKERPETDINITLAPLLLPETAGIAADIRF